jgi:hypothetical protein
VTLSAAASSPARDDRQPADRDRDGHLGLLGGRRSEVTGQRVAVGGQQRDMRARPDRRVDQVVLQARDQRADEDLHRDADADATDDQGRLSERRAEEPCRDRQGEHYASPATRDLAGVEDQLVGPALVPVRERRAAHPDAQVRMGLGEGVDVGPQPQPVEVGGRGERDGIRTEVADGGDQLARPARWRRGSAHASRRA